MTTALPPVQSQNHVDLHLKILGRTIEHFGVQMYKQRPAAIAELVANCWDAGANSVAITLPDYKKSPASQLAISIRDDGRGMSVNTVQDAYLVLGKNRREDPDPEIGGVEIDGRRIMGRKGIGKLAGFGIADEMAIKTWRDGSGVQFTLRLVDLLAPDTDVVEVPIVGTIFTPIAGDGPAGTVVELRGLRHATPLFASDLRRSLARRFSRVVQGKMTVMVDTTELPDPILDYDVIHQFPADFPKSLEQATLSTGEVIRFGYAYTQKTIKDSEMAGFAVLVHGKTAQAPPFFFRVENTASGQHATKYISGVIEADYLDDTTDSKTDVVSTDRQEIDWGHASCESLRVWGEKLARSCLAECTEFRGKRKADELSLDKTVRARLARLDTRARKQVNRMIGTITYTDPDDARALELVDSVLKVFEFRHFHDMVEDIEKASDDPNALAQRLDLIKEWKVLESRAIFEVIAGRIAIIDMFEGALVKNAPETAHTVGQSNLHDAIGRFPWLLNPDYNVFTEEKSLTKLLYDFFEIENKGNTEKDNERIDFCAIADDKSVIVVEIKRSGHPVTFDEIQRLERYVEKITAATEREVSGILIYGGNLSVSKQQATQLTKREDIELRPWASLFDLTKRRYNRYRALLEGVIDHPDFKGAEGEVAQIRSVVQDGSFYRDADQRKHGMGSQEK